MYRFMFLLEMIMFWWFFKGLNLEGMDFYVLWFMMIIFCLLGFDEGVLLVVIIVFVF